MRVCVVPADEGGCGYYRLIWPAEVLIEQGYDVTISTREAAAETPADDYDVVVIQRPTKAAMGLHIQQMQRAGIAVVVEIDDDFSSIPRNNSAWSQFNPHWNKESNWSHLAAASQAADLVTVSTPRLAERYGANGRGSVLMNYFPERYLSIEGELNERPTVGWTGTPTTHADDLDVVGIGVAQAVEDTGSRFRAIGSPATHHALGVTGDTVEWCDLLTTYPMHVANLDVGIVPLADNRFNEAKSWLKGLEYAALGVPFVASPVREYVNLYQYAGRLANRPREWRTQLRELLANEEYRLEAGAHGREGVKDLTIEKNAWRWMETWEQALKNRKRKVA